jgi:hypothetical protein
MNRLDIQSALVARAVRESAGRFSGDRGEVSRLWHEVGASLEHLAAAFSPEALSDLTQFLEDNEYPPMHHSTSYREYNRPAYRVLLRGELEMLMPDLPASDLWR